MQHPQIYLFATAEPSSTESKIYVVNNFSTQIINKMMNFGYAPMVSTSEKFPENFKFSSIVKFQHKQCFEIYDEDYHKTEEKSNSIFITWTNSKFSNDLLFKACDWFDQFIFDEMIPKFILTRKLKNLLFPPINNFRIIE